MLRATIASSRVSVDEEPSSIVGLSLKALLPAAAWYFIVKVYRFSPHGAKKRYSKN
jgi:hypothetical protein